MFGGQLTAFLQGRCGKILLGRQQCLHPGWFVGGEHQDPAVCGQTLDRGTGEDSRGAHVGSPSRLEGDQIRGGGVTRLVGDKHLIEVGRRGLQSGQLQLVHGSRRLALDRAPVAEPLIGVEANLDGG